jgi:hypothetical protein
MLDAIAKASTTLFLLRVILLLVAVLLLCGAYILHLRSQVRKPLSSKFDFEVDGGYYLDRKTHAAICARCLAEDIVLHLQQHAPGLFRCTACKTTYVNGKIQRQNQTPNKGAAANVRPAGHDQ